MSSGHKNRRTHAGPKSVKGNRICTTGFSNPATCRLYKSGWPNKPGVRRMYHAGIQCGGCSFFAAFNADWGLCCRRTSRHWLETVFEHFTCEKHVNEGWGAHSFSERKGATQ